MGKAPFRRGPEKNLGSDTFFAPASTGPAGALRPIDLWRVGRRVCQGSQDTGETVFLDKPRLTKRATVNPMGARGLKGPSFGCKFKQGMGQDGTRGAVFSVGRGAKSRLHRTVRSWG